VFHQDAMIFNRKQHCRNHNKRFYIPRPLLIAIAVCHILSAGIFLEFIKLIHYIESVYNVDTL
jgi:hypothetical protein